MNYAYARVSAKDQNLQRQIAAFSEFGIEKSRIFSEKKSGKDLIDTFIYRVILYDDKMKVLFHLKGGQQGELLLNLIFPDYPDGHGNDGENARKMPENEKETDKAVSNSDINAECAYTSCLVELKAAKTHTVLYQINRTEYYCQVDLPLSDYPLYGKQLVASRG